MLSRDSCSVPTLRISRWQQSRFLRCQFHERLGKLLSPPPPLTPPPHCFPSRQCVTFRVRGELSRKFAFSLSYTVTGTPFRRWSYWHFPSYSLETSDNFHGGIKVADIPAGLSHSQQTREQGLPFLDRRPAAYHVAHP